jgi:16S rRNA (adenine1518-N6/adenine1519-N6)-dimethyltransferase
VLFRLVKAGFSQRRKTLLNSLSAGMRLDRATVQTICATAGIDPARRAQSLGLDDWNNLYQVYQTLVSAE